MKYGALEAVRAIEEGRIDTVDVRWRNSYDGSTRWSPMGGGSPLEQGVFPLQAEYRVREKKDA